MKRAAITGITGQDGVYLARLLLTKGYEVHGLLQRSFDAEEAKLRRRLGAEAVTAIHWHSGALEDPLSLCRFLRAARPGELYHLAGLTEPRHSFELPEATVASITLGTLRLLESARLVCPEARIFLASSSEIFGLTPSTPQTEATPTCPVSPYGIAKLAADQFGRLHREQHGQFVSIGILYNHESPLRPPNFLSSRVARGVAAIRRGQTRELRLLNLDGARDWSDARDFVRGFWQALQARAAGDYLFASGRQHRVRELVDYAFRAADLDYRDYVVAPKRKPAPASNHTGFCGSPEKAEQKLGWQRQWSLAQTMADMVQAELEERPEAERSDPVRKPGATQHTGTQTR